MNPSIGVDIDLDRLVSYLREHGVVHKTGPASVEKFPHGQSNPTYLLDVAGYKVVIRRKPFGRLLPSAHAIDREFTVMKALRSYSDVPVPNMIHLCLDASIIGSAFFVMEYVAGRIFLDPSLPGVSVDSRFAIYSDAIRVLAAIHSFDYNKYLSGFGGKPEQYARRQFEIWSRQYEASKLSDIPEFDALQKFLDDSLPKTVSSRCSLVHGDFRIDNCIIHPKDNRFIAVLDWELSTIGDPLCDLAYFCLMYHLPNVPGIPSLKGKQLSGIPQENDVQLAYSRMAGLPVNKREIQPLMALSCFRMACICQGVLKRSILGNASSKQAVEIGKLCPILSRIGLRLGRLDRTPNQITSTLSLQLEPFRMQFSPRFFDIRSRLLDFMETVIYPSERTYFHQQNSSPNRWEVPPIMESLKASAKRYGLFNLFLSFPIAFEGVRHEPLTNIEYAPLCEIMGTSVFLAPEACNCSAPDTGNMELLARYGTNEQKSEWLLPLLNGSIRSCFAMTERFVASSDASQIQCSIRQDGEFWIINGHKWWTSGAMHPNCKVVIVMGKTDPDGKSPFKQQSMVLVPIDTPGVILQRGLTVFGYDDAPEGHAELRFVNVRVPLSNLLGKRGDGFAMAQARLGPGRIHHCMRALGVGESALELMCKRAKCRSTFNKEFFNNDAILDDIAESRVHLDQSRALVLNAAAIMDVRGNREARHSLSIVKIAVPRAVLSVIDRAIQLHGAEGVGPDSPLPRLWAGIRSLRIADGPDSVHKFSVAKHELRYSRI